MRTALDGVLFLSNYKHTQFIKQHMAILSGYMKKEILFIWNMSIYFSRFNIKLQTYRVDNKYLEIVIINFDSPLNIYLRYTEPLTFYKTRAYQLFIYQTLTSQDIIYRFFNIHTTASSYLYQIVIALCGCCSGYDKKSNIAVDLNQKEV